MKLFFSMLTTIFLIATHALAGNGDLTVSGNLGVSGSQMGSPRTGMLGYSGGDYASVGYGFVPTATSSLYNYGINDTASQIRFTSGGFEFRSALAGLTGNPITWTTPMSIAQGGRVGIGGVSPWSDPNSLYIAGQLQSGGSVSGTYGALTVKGGKNGYSGLNFVDANNTNSGTLMMNNTYSGFYNGAQSGWRWYVSDQGDEYVYGNTNFVKANPTLNASSYLVIPGGAYFNSGTVYMEAAIQARGGLHNDTGNYLELNGGTTGKTHLTGALVFPDGTEQSTAGAASFSQNGYSKMPNGLIIQWGTVTWTSMMQFITFSIPFPNQCLSAVPSIRSPSDTNVNYASVPTTVRSVTRTGFESQIGGGTVSAGWRIQYIAIGY